MIARAVLKRGNAKSGYSVQQNLPKLGPPTVISQSCIARQQVSWSLARAAKRRSGSSLDQATGCPPKSAPSDKQVYGFTSCRSCQTDCCWGFGVPTRHNR